MSTATAPKTPVPPTPPASGPCVTCATHMHVNRCWQHGWQAGYEAALRSVQVRDLQAQISDLKSRLSWSSHTDGNKEGD